MSLQLPGDTQYPLSCLGRFCCFAASEALSQLNGTSVAALSFGALAVASAIFLILGLNEPYAGW
jgi:hypothetical protein